MQARGILLTKTDPAGADGNGLPFVTLTSLIELGCGPESFTSLIPFRPIQLHKYIVSHMFCFPDYMSKQCYISF
jgi:hypothetical protein